MYRWAQDIISSQKKKKKMKQQQLKEDQWIMSKEAPWKAFHCEKME